MKPLGIMAVLAGLVMLLVVLFTAPAAAAECGAHDYIVKQLAKQFSERRVAFAIIRPERLFIEFFANRETGTWTVLVTTPQRQTCLMSVGDGFTFDSGKADPNKEPRI